MMKRSKGIALIISAAMLMMSLAGCGGGTGGETNAAKGTDTGTSAAGTSEATDTQGAKGEDSNEQQTVTLLMDRETPHEGLNAVIATIEEKYNIVTEVEDIPSGTEGQNIRQTRFATGDMSDITFFNSGSLLTTMDPAKNFLDLTNESYISNIDESYLKTVTVEGKIYGVPANSTQAGAWMYNKKVYEELGLTVPKTWDELLANCEKIKEAGKTPVIGAYASPGWAQLVLLSDFYNVQAQMPDFAAKYSANKANFAETPIALRGFEKLYEIGEKGYFNEDFLAATPEDAYKMLAEGSGVMFPMLSGALASIAASYPDQINDIGMFAQPGDSAEPNGLTVWQPNAYYINKNAENLDAAKKWIEFFVSKEGVEIFAKAEKPLGPYVVKGVELPDDVYPAVKDLLPYFESGKIASALEFESPVKGPNLPQICVECASNMTDAKKCAETYDQDVIKQAKQLGLEGW